MTLSGFLTGPAGTVTGNIIQWNFSSLAPGTYTYGVEVTVLGTASGILNAQAVLGSAIGAYQLLSASVTVAPLTATPTATTLPVSKPVIYPNPVNGPGPVSIQLPNYPGLATVSVKVFTTAFRQVNSFTVSNQAGGTNVSLSLTDQRGAPLANGLYYVLVQTPLGRSIEKLLILR